MDVKNAVVRGRKRKCMERRREILTVIQAAHTRDPINLTTFCVRHCGQKLRSLFCK